MTKAAKCVWDREREEKRVSEWSEREIICMCVCVCVCVKIVLQNVFTLIHFIHWSKSSRQTLESKKNDRLNEMTISVPSFITFY